MYVRYSVALVEICIVPMMSN